MNRGTTSSPRSSAAIFGVARGRRHAVALTSLALFVVTFWPCEATLAVSAKPGTVTLSQPGGEEILVVPKGDEFGHWYEDAQGRLITKSPESGQWVYAVEAEGQASPSPLVVGEDDVSGLEFLFNASAERMSMAVARRAAGKQPARSSPQRSGVSGVVKNLVILVNFTDKTITQTTNEFDDLCNEEGYNTDGANGSIKDYYKEISYDALTLESTVVNAVTLDNGYAYYGQNDAWGEDLRPALMVQEALAKLETRGFDFSTMDANGDGYVDCLTVVHAGVGEEIGTDPDAIWSHKWQLGSPVTYDGVVLQPYVTVPAIRDGGGGIVRIGVPCHELGHHFGLPDLYDRDGSSEGAGDFCLMAGGAWNGGDGKTPAHMCAWCKMKLDWISPTVVSTAGTYNVGQLATNAQAYKLQGAFPANEYFLIENRQGSGFDAGLPGADRGLLIWHVDDTKTDNDDETHYMVALKEASETQHLAQGENRGNDDDYWRQGTATTFNNTTTPSTQGHGGTPLGLGVQNISATGATMTFTINLIDPLSISGYIRTSDGQGVASVNVNEDQDGGWDITDTDGYYRIPIRYGWSGTITPTKTGYTFGPANMTFNNVTASITMQNYTATETGAGGGSGTLSIRTEDEDGEAVQGGIYVDGNYKGVGSWSGTVAVGTYQVSFGALEDYSTPNAKSASVTDGQTTSVVGVYTSGGTSGSSLSVSVTADRTTVSPGASALVTAAASGGSGPYKYEWDWGYTRPSFIAQPKVTTTYHVTVTDSINATATGSIKITVTTSKLSASITADPQTVQEGGSSALTVSASGGVSPYTYKWSTGETTESITVTPNTSTQYSVTVKDASGQQVIATTTVNTPSVAGEIVGGGGNGSAPCMAPMGPPLLMFAAALAGWIKLGTNRSRAKQKS